MWFGLMTFKKIGDKVEEHKHMFDHVTLLSSGSFKVIKYNLSGDVELNEVVESPCLIHIEKGKNHSIEALTENSIACCCHAIYESENDKFPVDTSKVPLVGGSLKIPLICDNLI